MNVWFRRIGFVKGVKLIVVGITVGLVPVEVTVAVAVVTVRAWGIPAACDAT